MIGESVSFQWPYVVVCAVLWGGVASLAITLTQAVGDLGFFAWLAFFGKIAPSYVVTGLVWATGAKLGEDLHRPVAVIAATALLAPPVNIATSLVLANVVAPGDFGHVWALPFSDFAVYVTWTSSFYGGLYVLGFFTSRRALSLRRRLAYHRVARDEAEAQWREARLRTVRDQVQPAMILEALGALSRALSSGGGDLQRLFDLLISFLRAVTPDLRGEAPTLAREISALRHYDALRQALPAGSPPWRIRVPEAMEGMSSGPVRLLSTVHRISGAAPPNAILDITGGVEDEDFVLTISACATPPLPPRVLDRLRAQIRLEGAPWTACDLQGPAIAEVRIPPHAPALTRTDVRVSPEGSSGRGRPL